MLELTVNMANEENVLLEFEHSLLSLSKWESKYKKPFLSTTEKTSLEMIHYFQCMLLNKNVKKDIVYRLSPEQLSELSDYINDSMTASSVPQEQSKGSQEIVTSELIYFWLVTLKIPFNPAETWHLNRLMMLIQITNYKNQPDKKRSKAEMMSKWRAANEQRKKQYGTKG